MQDIVNYLAGRGSLIVLGFITFPILTRLLSVEAYGVVSLTFRLVLLLVVLSKCGLQYSAARFFRATDSDTAEQRRFYSTLLLCPVQISLVVSLIYVAILLCNTSIRHDTLLFHCLLLAPGVVLLRTVQSMLLSFLRNEGRSRAHTIAEVATKLTTVVALVTLALAGQHRAFPVLLGTLAGESAVVAFQLQSVLQRGLIRFGAIDWELIRQSLLFGVPLIVYELSSLVLDSADRLIVQRYLGDHSLGIYSAAYGISGYVQDTVMTPLNLALFPVYMRIWNEQGRDETIRFLSNALSWFLVLALFIIGASWLSAKDALILLASRRFLGADQLLMILVPALMIYALHIFLNVGLILEKRTTMLALIAAFSAVVNIAANVYWIPRIGLTGAALATLVSYLAMIAGLLIVNRKILPLQLKWPLVVSGTLAMLLSYPLPTFLHARMSMVTLVGRNTLYSLLFVICLLLFSAEFRGLVQQSRVRFLWVRRKNWAAMMPARSTVGGSE
ncbi:membrane protein involved in the export of O-antigen and teichoic acid [Terriglobus roseus DSM 18391]|uniref:Membrane protein involved in the export of O-antigen and teichoic acid n=2 Tax=Terriglobus roseus TaxID=392734 RepID=I3ZE89_TERRK|nr:membrane protein involved in the export of O-antigen and teichoic acid [Terriglobus roseus DSM 18391]